MIGQTIGRYKILDKLGSGGMGEVYRAEDTSLGRPVALKFLAAHLLNDDEAKQRFLREAKAAAAITHPNICHVYEVAEQDGKTFLAMAYLEGESLEELIAKGPLPIKDAVEIGRQVAEGLKAAHAKGIVHRDIKPANIMVDGEGRATILDFGLARLTEASKLTRQDQTVGTTAYMSPEQIQGGEVDHRSDIWALGCVLYEIVAGVRPFKGQYDQALAYEVVHEQPEPLTGIRTGVPVGVETVAAKCLAKDPNERYQSVAELLVDLNVERKRLDSGSSRATPPSTFSQTGKADPASSEESSGELTRLRSHRSMLTAALVVCLAVVAFQWSRGAGESPERPVRKFSFSEDGDGITGRISPDGRYIAYSVLVGGNSGVGGLRLRDLESGETKLLPGTEGLALGGWSPDSRFIVFAAADGKSIQRIDIRNDSIQRICTVCTVDEDLGDVQWWTGRDSIVFSTAEGLFEVPAGGGQPVLLLAAQDGELIGFPHSIEGFPDSLLLTVVKDGASEVVLQDLADGQRYPITPGSDALYSPSGHIIYRRASATGTSGLWAAAYSLAKKRLLGEPFRIAGGYYPSIATDGTLVFSESRAPGRERLVLRDRRGVPVGHPGKEQGQILVPEFSPNGSRILTWSIERDSSLVFTSDIWVHEADRPVSARVIDYPGREDSPVWSPSGEELAFTSFHPGTVGAGAYVRRVGAQREEPKLLFDSSGENYPIDWSSDGRYIVLVRLGLSEQNGIWYVKRNEDGSWAEPQPFATSASADYREPRFSPDGRHLIYTSEESGRSEIYVQEFPGGGGKRQVTTNGGVQPIWRGDGKEIFFFQDAVLMAAPVSNGPPLNFGAPKRLFEDQTAIRRRGHQYDVSDDGERFVMVEVLEDRPPPSVRIVLNWYAEFRGRE